jgi:protein TonB
MKNVLWATLLLILSTSCFAQIDTIYFNKYFRKASKQEHEYYGWLIPEGGKYKREIYYPSGALKLTSYCLDKDTPHKSDGLSLEYDSIGKLYLQQSFSNGKLNGELIKYYSSGKVRRREVYEMDSMRSGHCFDTAGGEVPYFPAMVLPHYPGGDSKLFKLIKKHIVYPPRARAREIEGRVVVGFVVDENGNITDIVVKRSTNPLFDQSAVDAVSKLKPFTPGKIEGERAKIPMVLPINFKLSSNDGY